MISKKKYSIRKVSVGTASVLIGIATGSLGTAYAQEEINNVAVSAEVNRNVSEKPVDKPILEESMKPSSSPKATSKPTRADALILTPAPARPSSPIPTPAPEIKPIPSADVPDENIARTPGKEDKIDWTLIKEKEYLSYSLENIIDGKEKERLVNSLRAAKSTDDLVKIRNEYEVIKKAEEKQKELENRVYSLKRVHNLYLSDDQNEKFTKEVALAKNDNELNEIVEKYKLIKAKTDLKDDYDYRIISRDEIDSANSIVELNNLKEKYKLLNLKKELQSLVNRTSSTHRDENTGKELSLLSKDRMEVLLKEIEALKTPEKAEELRKIIDAEVQLVYRREEFISRIKYRLTDLTDEQLVPFVNELEKYITEANLNKVKEKIEAEDKKLREERIKKEQSNILEVLNTKAKLNDYEKEKLKQEMVELYRKEYKERPERGEEQPNYYHYYGAPIYSKYNRVGKSHSEYRLLENVERIESLKNDNNLSEIIKNKYIEIILENNNHHNTDRLIEFESFIGKIQKSNLVPQDKKVLTERVREFMKYFVNPNYSDKSSFFEEQKNILEKLEKLGESVSLPVTLKTKIRLNLLNENLEGISDDNIDYFTNFYILKNRILTNSIISSNVLNELKNHLLNVENEEILPLIKDLSKRREFWSRPRIFRSDSKLSQLTTKVESLEKLYSYIHIPEYKLIKFRDEILDATSSGNVRNTLATARAVEETLEILGYNGNYPKVEDRLKDKKVTPKEEKVTETKKENKEPAKAEDKKDNKESVKEPDNKGVPKGQTVPENKQEVPSKETPKVTSDKTDSSNDKKQETSENNTPVENYILSATLSGHDVAVSFDKNKIKADDIFVGAINDEKLNKDIIEKLGSEYKILEVFEIHFKKDGKKLDSGSERTVRVSVVKNDNAELEVYHISDNNVLEKVKSKYSDGSLQFKIDHFSKFTILERSRTNTKNLESRVQMVPLVKEEYNVEEVTLNNYPGIDDRNNVKLKELSKTGLSTTKELGVALLALGVAITIRKRSKFH